MNVVIQKYIFASIKAERNITFKYIKMYNLKNYAIEIRN